MKKYRGIISGIVVSLWYCIMETFLFNSPFERNEKYVVFHYLLSYILPSLSGVLSVLFLRCNTIKDFFRSFGIYFTISLALIMLYEFSGLPRMMHFWFRGYDELSLGHGILFILIFSTHLISCFIGVIVAGIISLYRQKKNCI